MLQKTLNIRQRYHPIPITVLIAAANSCDCDVFIDYGHSRVNVKNYEEMKKGFNTQSSRLLFCFSGSDEEYAEQRIEQLFVP